MGVFGGPAGFSAAVSGRELVRLRKFVEGGAMVTRKVPKRVHKKTGEKAREEPQIPTLKTPLKVPKVGSYPPKVGPYTKSTLSVYCQGNFYYLIYNIQQQVLIQIELKKEPIH